MPVCEEQKKLYDATCKQVLSEKGILAHIMHGCLAEFRAIPPQEIALQCIEGTPSVASIPVMGEELLPRISGLPSENSTADETATFFDVYFSALAPPLEDPVQLFLNVEAQNNSSPGYPILKRGTFYACRLISAQYGTVFTHSNYGKIRKVASIWICTRPAKNREYTINAYSMQETLVAGNYRASPEHYDLLTIVVINLGKKHFNELHGLFRLLNAIFLDRMKAKDLKHLIEDEYSIHLTPSLKKGVDAMCNLSEGLIEEAMEEGLQKGLKKGLQDGLQKGEDSATVKNLRSIMQKMHLTAEEAMDLFDIPAVKRPGYAELL